jgi:hypothetical protein
MLISKWKRILVAGLLALGVLAPAIHVAVESAAAPPAIAGCDDYDCGPISTWST